MSRFIYSGSLFVVRRFGKAISRCSSFICCASTWTGQIYFWSSWKERNGDEHNFSSTLYLKIIFQLSWNRDVIALRWYYHAVPLDNWRIQDAFMSYFFFSTFGKKTNSHCNNLSSFSVLYIAWFFVAFRTMQKANVPGCADARRVVLS